MTEPAKRKKPFSSTAATLKWARDTFGKGSVAQTSWWQGFQGADQEGNPRKGGVRKDAWGFQDCQVLDGLPGVLALQACGTDVGAHKKKMEEPELSQTVAKWLGAGNRILIVAWREVWQQTSERHKLKKWTPRFLSCSIDDRSISFHGEVPLRWTEHEAWPIPLSGGVADAKQVDISGLGPPPMTTGTPEATLCETSGAPLQPKLFGGTDGQSEKL